MNACEKELAAALAYNRFMERRVAQLESHVKVLLKEKATGAWGGGAYRSDDVASNKIGGGGSISSTGPGAIKPSNLTTRQRSNSALSSNSPVINSNVIDEASEAFAGMGSGMNVVEELLRLRGENDLLKQHYRDRVGDINNLKAEADEASQQVARLLTVNEQLRFEIGQLKEVLPTRLYAERSSDGRRVKEILAKASKARQEFEASEAAAAKATKSLSIVSQPSDSLSKSEGFNTVSSQYKSARQVATFFQEETAAQRAKMKQMQASDADATSDPATSFTNIDTISPSWRFENIFHFASQEDGAKRAVTMLREVDGALEAVKASARAIDDTIATYNVVARHAVAIVVQGQSCTSVAECLETKKAAADFLLTMNSIRDKRKEGLATTKEMLPTVATGLRQVSNALIGAMTLRLSRTSRPLITQLEMLAVKCQSFDTSSFASPEALNIPAGATELVLQMIVNTDEDATAFERIEVSDIRGLSNDMVRAEGDLSSEFVSLSDKCVALVSQCRSIVLGKAEKDVDAAANEYHASKGSQCNLINPKMELTEAERQYEKLLRSFLDARAIEREAGEEIRSQARQSRANLLKEEAGALPAWASGAATNSFRRCVDGGTPGSQSPFRNGSQSPRFSRGQSPSVIIKEKAEQIAARRLRERSGAGNTAGDPADSAPEKRVGFDPIPGATVDITPPVKLSTTPLSDGVRRALAASSSATARSTPTFLPSSRGTTPSVFDQHNVALAEILGS